MSAAQALRQKQAPIKDGYRSDPSSAVVTLKSTGSLDDHSITCKLSDSSAVKEAHRVAGLHQKAGGDDPAISGELCSGGKQRLFEVHIRQTLTSYTDM
jgi:hypothetical protein